MLMRKLSIVVVLVAGLTSLVSLVGCNTAPATREGKNEIEQEATVARDRAVRTDPTLAQLLSSAAGYAVFPSVGKGAAGVGGAYGKGVLYESGYPVGYCDLTQATVGFQLGGQSYTQIIVFENQDAVRRFKDGNFRFAAQATAVALKSGAGTNAKYSDGAAVFTMDEAGLMYEAAIGGQKFSYEPRYTNPALGLASDR